MKAAALHSDSDSFSELITQFEKYMSVEIFQKGKDLLSGVAAEGHTIVLFDLDIPGAVVDEINQKLAEASPDTLRIFKAQKLTPQLLSKHQDSPHGGDFYFDQELTPLSVKECLDELDLGPSSANHESEIDDLDEATVIGQIGNPIQDFGDEEEATRIGAEGQTDALLSDDLDVDASLSSATVVSREDYNEALPEEPSPELPEVAIHDLGDDSEHGELTEGVEVSDLDEIGELDAIDINFDATSDEEKTSTETINFENSPEDDDAPPLPDIFSETNSDSSTDLLSDEGDDEDSEEESIFGQALGVDEKSFESLTRDLSVEALKQLDEMDDLINQTRVEDFSPTEDPSLLENETLTTDDPLNLNLGDGPPIDINDSMTATHVVDSGFNNEAPELSDQTLTQFGNTISELGQDRKDLLLKIQSLEKALAQANSNALNFKTDAEEKIIQNTLLNRKMSGLTQKRDQKVSTLEHHNDYLKEKNKSLQLELKKLNKVLRVDFNAVKAKEHELENQLELLKSDSSYQIKNRDKKIVELKRRIDALEFELNSINQDYLERVRGQGELEEKLSQVVSGLKGAIDVLEENQDIPLGLVNGLKKNLNL